MGPQLLPSALLGPQRTLQAVQSRRESRSTIDRHPPAGRDPGEPVQSRLPRRLPERARHIAAESRRGGHPGLRRPHHPRPTDGDEQRLTRFVPGPQLTHDRGAQRDHPGRPPFPLLAPGPPPQPPAHQRHRHPTGQQRQHRLPQHGDDQRHRKAEPLPPLPQPLPYPRPGRLPTHP